MDEAYLLLLLSDSNLPTGAFVASSGLESFLAHGFGAPPPQSATPTLKSDTIAAFVRDSLNTYAPSALPFVSDAHEAVGRLRTGAAAPPCTLALLKALDGLYECTTLNHVARRASASQGVALLSLYAKGFARPPGHAASALPAAAPEAAAMAALVDAFKLTVRRGERDAHAHLPVCWGILCAALGLSLERTQHLHLYLHARSLLSAAVRLNSIGPYAAQQILLHVCGALVDAAVRKCARLRTGVLAEDGDGWDEVRDGPANTWPLGEILAARHDLQHSRIFNS
ncbi:urease accessory protein UreF [Mycena belliarum]|uniref:Urease accessory protein UreF n=1 Tax=Mycena belliarum TaxID=1033014 RepID=A0AAD6U9M0_9AGAR|nr:urease accessory protein UreF [Mycena belliae]